MEIATCINNEPNLSLTIGKVYKIISADNKMRHYEIINDKGDSQFYYQYRFKSKEVFKGYEQ